SRWRRSSRAATWLAIVPPSACCSDDTRAYRAARTKEMTDFMRTLLDDERAIVGETSSRFVGAAGRTPPVGPRAAPVRRRPRPVAPPSGSVRSRAGGGTEVASGGA